MNKLNCTPVCLQMRWHKAHTHIRTQLQWHLKWLMSHFICWHVQIRHEKVDVHHVWRPKQRTQVSNGVYSSRFLCSKSMKRDIANLNKCVYIFIVPYWAYSVIYYSVFVFVYAYTITSPCVATANVFAKQCSLIMQKMWLKTTRKCTLKC